MVFTKFEQLKTKHQILVALLVIIGVVSTWRAVWSLSDLYLFPADPTLSYVISLVFGILVVVITHYTIKEGLEEIVG